MKNLLTYLLAILAFVSCSESGIESGGSGGGQETPKQPEITLSTTAANFTTDGGSDVITFTSSEAWTAEVINSRADDWCSIDPKSGAAGSAKITVTTTANDTPDDRTASIIIKAGTASKTINVSQKQKDALTVTSSKFEVSAEGGEITIEVKANINFDFEIDDDAEDWITHRSTRALKTSQLVFEVDKNEDTENRKANISISSGNLRETVTIYQEGNEPTIVLSDDEFTVSSSKETIAIDVKSNVDVAVEIPSNTDWIKENTTRAFSTNTYYFDIEQNDGHDNRTAEIKFTNNENGIYEKVKITQLQHDAIVVAESEYTLNEDGGELDFEIKTNVDVEVSISQSAQSWIKQVETRGLQSKTLHFDIAANDSDNDREGTITLSGGDAKQTIKVKQISTNKQIIYTSTDGRIVTPYNTSAFGASIISNVYEDGKGIITFDKKVTKIGFEAFNECRTLESITMPNSVKTIENKAFWDCSGLINIPIPRSVIEIGRGAFYGCVSLMSIIIPDGVSVIKLLTFRGCSSLTDIFIPTGVISIEDQAFEKCSSLRRITIPASTSSIGHHAFAECSSLESIVIPHTVTNIAHSTFFNCRKLKHIELPNSIVQIGKYAFHYCESLVNIQLPYNLNSIDIGTFLYCTSLVNVYIPESVTTIGDDAFSYCESLQRITIPSNVTKLGKEVFDSCRKLKEVYMKPITPPSIGTNVFKSNDSGRKIYVPEVSADIYKSTSGWSAYASDIVGHNF